jgi:hypothetical protein
MCAAAALSKLRVLGAHQNQNPNQPPTLQPSLATALHLSLSSPHLLMRQVLCAHGGGAGGSLSIKPELCMPRHAAFIGELQGVLWLVAVLSPLLLSKRFKAGLPTTRHLVGPPRRRAGTTEWQCSCFCEHRGRVREFPQSSTLHPPLLAPPQAETNAALQQSLEQTQCRYSAYRPARTALRQDPAAQPSRIMQPLGRYPALSQAL